MHATTHGTHGPDRMIGILNETLTALVSGRGPDLTARQTAILLTCFRSTEPQTVRGLARRLNISKPAVTRALDKLEGLGFLARAADPADRRSVLVCPARGGDRRDRLRETMSGAARAVDAETSAAPDALLGMAA